MSTIRVSCLPAVTLAAVIAVSCVERREHVRREVISPVTAELSAMLEEDQRLRSADSADTDLIQTTDLKHRKRVFDLLARGLITNGEDLYSAAMILQHADPPSCVECYLLAHFLARRAVENGHESARYLTAACLDRYLVLTGEAQKFGTQYYEDSLGSWMLYPVDSTTSDSMRALWDVPPLDSIRANLLPVNDM